MNIITVRFAAATWTVPKFLYGALFCVIQIKKSIQTNAIQGNDKTYEHNNPRINLQHNNVWSVRLHFVALDFFGRT